jgi:hypothetical protein
MTTLYGLLVDKWVYYLGRYLSITPTMICLTCHRQKCGNGGA